MDALPGPCRWLLAHVPPIQCVTLGGSRARGGAHPDSDYDIFVFTEDDAFPAFVRGFTEALARGMEPVVSLRPPSLTRGFGIQYSASNATYGPVDYFLVAPFLIQPFDRFEHHKVLVDEDSFFRRRVLGETRQKNALSGAALLDWFEFRLASLYTETKRSSAKGEAFHAEQMLLEFRASAYGAIKAICYGEPFDFTTRARRSRNESAVFRRMDDCVRRNGLLAPSACIDELLVIFLEALESTRAVPDERIRSLRSHFDGFSRSAAS